MAGFDKRVSSYEEALAGLEDGIRDFCLSRGLGDVYKRQLTRLSKPAICTSFIICGRLASRMAVSYTHLTLPTTPYV